MAEIYVRTNKVGTVIRGSNKYKRDSNKKPQARYNFFSKILLQAVISNIPLYLRQQRPLYHVPILSILQKKRLLINQSRCLYVCTQHICVSNVYFIDFNQSYIS
jgi:hypothetical protein